MVEIDPNATPRPHRVRGVAEPAAVAEDQQDIEADDPAAANYCNEIGLDGDEESWEDVGTDDEMDATDAGETGAGDSGESHTGMEGIHVETDFKLTADAGGSLLKRSRRKRVTVAHASTLDDGTEDNGSTDEYLQVEGDGEDEDEDEDEDIVDDRREGGSVGAKGRAGGPSVTKRGKKKAKGNKKSTKGGAIPAASWEALRKGNEVINDLVTSIEKQTGLTRPRICFELGIRDKTVATRGRNLWNSAERKYAVDYPKQPHGECLFG